MAGYAAANIVDFVRGFGERKKQSRVNEQLQNYLVDPTGTIGAINEIDAPTALALKDKYTADMSAQRAAAQAAEDRDLKLTGERQKQALGAVRTMATMLKAAKPENLGGTFDGLTPVLKNALGMGDEEIVSWRERIVNDPTLLDSLIRDADQKLTNVTPGSAVLDAQGNVVFQNPVTPKVLEVENATGGRDVIAVDPVTGTLVGGGRGGTPAVGTYNGPIAVNPQARGIRNNNPLNIKDGRYARGQRGFRGSDGTFAQFESPEAGQAAAANLLQGYFAKGKNTVQTILDGTGPGNPGWLGWPGAKGDDNSAAARANYKAYVAGRLGVAPDAPIPVSRLPELIQAMAEFENGSGQAAAASSRGRGGAIYSTQGAPPKPAEGFEIMTPEQVAAAGLREGIVYQRSTKTGKIAPVAGQGSKGFLDGAANKKAAASATITAYSKMKRLRDEAERLLNSPDLDSSVGPLEGRFAGYVSSKASGYQKALEAFGSRIFLESLVELKAASKTGASGLGAVNMKEGEALKSQLGTLDATSNEEEIRRSLREVLG